MRDLEKLDPIIMTVHETSGRRLNDRRTPALHIWKRAIHNRTMTNNQQYVVKRKKNSDCIQRTAKHIKAYEREHQLPDQSVRKRHDNTRDQ